MKNYPQSVTDQNVSEIVQQVCRLRIEDITDRNNFPYIFVSGRSVNKVPTGSADVAATDRIGDINLTKDYIYTCVSDGAGASVWRRVAQASW